MKRFTNIYRFIRISLDDSDFEKFVGIHWDKNAEFRVVSILLALNTGFPQIGSDLLKALAWPSIFDEGIRLQTLNDYLNWIARISNHTENRFAEDLKDNGLIEDLRKAHNLLKKFAKEVPSEIEPWQRWAKVVGRFSMYWDPN